MFTYLDPQVRTHLIAQGKLVRVDEQGQLIDVHSPEAPGELAINLLGPIPLPISLPSIQTTVSWYAAVRSTELSQVNALASDLRARGGQHLFFTFGFTAGGEQRVGSGRAHRKPSGSRSQQLYDRRRLWL